MPHKGPRAICPKNFEIWKTELGIGKIEPEIRKTEQRINPLIEPEIPCSGPNFNSTYSWVGICNNPYCTRILFRKLQLLLKHRFDWNLSGPFQTRKGRHSHATILKLNLESAISCSGPTLNWDYSDLC